MFAGTKNQYQQTNIYVCVTKDNLKKTENFVRAGETDKHEFERISLENTHKNMKNNCDMMKRKYKTQDVSITTHLFTINHARTAGVRLDRKLLATKTIAACIVHSV